MTTPTKTSTRTVRTTSSRRARVPLCPYQKRWIDDRSRFKIAVKARRIGFTFATTLEIALDLVARKTRWLIISRTQDTAKEALKEVRNHFTAMRIVAGGSATIAERPTDLFFDGMRVNQYVIALPNGSEIVAMTAHPDAARGFGGNVFLDEHGFHRDSEELWKGAAAAVLRGHRLIVVSTPHYQTGNFYRLAREANLVNGKAPAVSISVSKSSSAIKKTPAQSIWSAHWVDIYSAVPELAEIGVSVDLAELRALAGDEDSWKQEFCCQFLSAAEMWIPLELIAAARSPLATLEWDPDRDYSGELFVGADIGRKRDRTAIWIDERVADVAICRGVITMERTSFERQYEAFCELLAHPKVRRAAIDQTGIGMALVERLQERFGSKVEGITFTAPLKEEMSIRVRRRLEERLDKIPENAPSIERDMAAVKREVTSSGNLRFDAERTEASHADIYWAKALADTAAGSTVRAVSFGTDPVANQFWDRRQQFGKLGREDDSRTESQGADFASRPSIWDGNDASSRFSP